MLRFYCFSSFFFFNDTATTEIYTLSLHDALPIYRIVPALSHCRRPEPGRSPGSRDGQPGQRRDRKSTRLNSSHGYISYAVFCLKKKKKMQKCKYIKGKQLITKLASEHSASLSSNL